MTGLQIQVLGHFHLLSQDEPLTAFNQTRLQALLTCLLLQPGKPYLRQRLAFLLWPDSSEGQARTNLRHLVHTLRQNLPAGDLCLRVDSQALEWRADAPSACDLIEFERAIVQADLERAVTLYRGDLLPGCYDDWIVPERERLRRMFMEALEALIQRHEDHQAYQTAVMYAQRLLQQDPLREASYQRLMRLYALSGDRASVTRTFQTCVTVLERELGVEPGEATRTLYVQMLRLDAPLPPMTYPQAVRPGFLQATPLPLPLTSFIGREREIEEVKSLLLPSMAQAGAPEAPAVGARLLTVTGAGGCGKTRLALQVASQIQAAETFVDDVWLVELASLADPTLVAQTIAAAFGVREQPHSGGTQPLVETLIDALRPRSLLLLLDNCEHLIEICARLVEALLRTCPHLRILATSREPLGIAGEIVWQAPSLALPNAHTPPAQVPDVEAVRLFVERARAALPTFQLTSPNAHLVAKICRQLDGIPLAIELAAARVKVLSIEQLAARLAGALDERFRLLSGGSRTVGRHQTLRAAIDWSYDLLFNDERILFRRLSIFAGGFTLEAAETICSPIPSASGLSRLASYTLPSRPANDLLNLLAHLVDKSLVIVDVERQPAGEVRYRLLETLRQYSRERLRATGEEEDLQERHAHFFLTLVESADVALNGPDELRMLLRLEAEHDNLREVLRWCQASPITPDERVALGLKLVSILWKFWTIRSYHREGFDTMRRLLALPGVSTPPITRLYALNGAGFLGQELGDYATAQRLLEESAAIATSLGDLARIGDTILALASNAISQGDFVTARPLAERSLLIRRQLGTAYEIAHALILLGLVALFQGNYAEAQAHFEEGIALLRTLGSTNFLAYSLRQLARAMLLQGVIEPAAAICRESLTLNLQLQSQLGVLACLAGLVGILLADGQLTRAARLSGAVAMLLHTSGLQLLPVELAAYEKNLAALRAQLDEAAWTAAWESGHTMTLEQAVADVLDKISWLRD